MKSKQDFLSGYRGMVAIRRLEEKSAELYQQGKIGGFLHLYIGQEAVAVGMAAAITKQDHVITAYRDHGVAYSVGMPAKIILAEMLGKAAGCSGGKGGSMHLVDPKLNFWGGHAIVGSHLPLAAGIATSLQYQKLDGVVVCMFGDGATNIGYFHEALNLSKVWQLPVVWLCENNSYVMGTAVDRASAVHSMCQKAEGYGMANAFVDGMDLEAVHSGVINAAAHARAGAGPFFLEVQTYRFRGHSMGDPERYRTAEEIKHWQDGDPITALRKRIVGKQLGTEAELDALDREVDAEIAAAVQFSEESPEPADAALCQHVYSESPNGRA